MRNSLMTATIMAMSVAGLITVNAQSSPSAPNPPQSTANAGQNVSVTGCLRDHRDAAGTPGNRGTGSSTSGTSAANSGQNFVLMNAKMAQGSSASGIGSVSTIHIQGLSDAEMKKHVGHQVEVMGRLSASSTSGTAATRSGTTGATGSGATGSGTATSGTSTGATGSTGRTTGQGSGSAMSAQNLSDMPRLQATSIKMIAATCPAQ
jgi:hypothetical protein